MTDCDCCRFRSEASLGYDPTCARNFLTFAALNPAFEIIGDLSLSASDLITIGAAGTGTGSGTGSGGTTGTFRHYRLPHLAIISNGFNVLVQFNINGTGSSAVTRPTIGKQRAFAFGWCLELDWSDEILRAYSCDDEGVPTGEAWYEQETSAFWDSTNHDDLSLTTISLDVRLHEREISTGVYRRVISLNFMPIASKDFSSPASPFWYGFSAEHLGDDMSTSGGLTCNHFVSLPSDSTSWWCSELPFMIAVDTTDLSWDLWAGNKQAHFPDSCILIPSVTTGFWEYRKTFVDGEGEFTPNAICGPSNVGGDWGIFGRITEGTPLGTLFSPSYFEQGTSNTPKAPKPPAWACDESASRSLPIETAAPSQTFDTNPTTFDFQPEGLITPASPP